MDFSLTQEQLEIVKVVRAFGKREVLPYLREADRGLGMPDHILPAMAKLGILGICIPVKYGGQGFDYTTLGLVCEELEAVDTSLRVVLSVHIGLNSLGILQWGTEEQKQKYLIPQARGEKIAMFGLTETEVGSDVAGMRSTARRQGDNYLLNGEKMWISLATKADHILFFARTNPEQEDPHDQLSAFIVETNWKGVTTGDIHNKLGVRAGSTGWVNCQDVVVPVENRLGEEGEGFKIAMSCLDNGRFTVGSGAVGLIRAAMEASVAYANERKAFGKEIGKYQLVQQKIARMERDYQLGRLQYLKVGWLKNEGKRNTRETSLLKWFATDASFEAANEAVQIHGANGFSDEYPVERYLRNSKGAVIYEGTSEIHQLMQAGYVLGYRKDSALRRELPAYDEEEWLLDG